MVNHVRLRIERNNKVLFRFVFIALLIFGKSVFASSGEPAILNFPSGALTLRGELFMPEGEGPFPAILYNHGSAPKMLNSQAGAAIGPMFSNDYDISPSKVLSSKMENTGKIARVKIFPNYGNSVKEGHSFPYRGVSIWFDDVYSFVNKYCHSK